MSRERSGSGTWSGRDRDAANTAEAGGSTSVLPRREGEIAGDEDRPLKRRRHRTNPSCIQCQKRKTKCNRPSDWTEGDRCDLCAKRKEECTFPPPVPSRLDVPDDLAGELHRLKARMRRLEEMVATKQDKPESAQPSDVVATFYSPSNQSLPEINTETEDAAQALEDVFLMGRRQYAGPLALNSEIPAPKTTTPTFVGPGAFTSIFLVSSRPVHNQAETEHLLQALPEKDVSDILVEAFLTQISASYHVLHAPMFRDECRQLYHAARIGNLANIDPAWISIFFRVLAWGVSFLSFQSDTHPAFALYSPHDVKSLPALWSSASDQALFVSSWAAKPQLRAVQSILLKISYERPGAQAAPGASEGTGFFVWLSAAIRICQLLGLHRLGSDPKMMPPNDPGLPEPPCLLKRELAKRVWYFCVSHDYMFVSAADMGQIAPNSFNTNAPLNLDDEDLGLTLDVPEHPDDYTSDYSQALNLFTLGQFQRIAADLSQSPTPIGYETILKLSESLEAQIQFLESKSYSNPRLQPHHKYLLLGTLHNRVVRLHRPFFMKGIRLDHPEDARYTASVTASLHSASAVAVCLRALGARGHQPPFWWIPAYGIASALVLWMRLIQKDELHEDAREDCSLILAIREFYAIGASMSTPSAICVQACRIIDNLLAARHAQHSSAAEIFRNIATKVLESTAVADQVVDSSHPWGYPPGNATPQRYSSSHPPAPPASLFPTDLYPAFPTFNPPTLAPSSLHTSNNGTASFDSTATHDALLNLATLEQPQSFPIDWEALLENLDTDFGTLG